ncbi:MAG: hypothetical protein GY790_08750, partial [Bacteroidetes bacterium]|nr:hypothetical protein [Bacteroidota bacterium]
MKVKIHVLTSLIPILSLALLLTQCVGKSPKAGKEDANQNNQSCVEFPLKGWERFHSPAFKGFMHAYQPCVIEVPD